MVLNLQKKIKNYKSMRRKIMVPFLHAIVLVPVVTLLVFNFTVRQYITSGIIEQLESTVNTTQTIIKKELSQIIYETDNQVIEESINNLNRVLAGTIGTLNTELLLYSSYGERLYPDTPRSDFVDDEVLTAISENLENISSQELEMIKINGQEYAAMGYKITALPLSNVPIVVFVSSMNASDSLFSRMNSILIVLIFVGTMLGLGMSFRISRKVASPLKELSEATKHISEGKDYEFTNNTNILEIVELNKSIEYMTKKLNSYYRAQVDFLQNASHELKSPLMSIEGYAQGIELNLLKDKKKAAAIIFEESKRLEKIIADLLAISRIENQNYDLEQTQGEVDDLIEEYIEKVKGMAFKDKKEIKYYIKDSGIKLQYNEILLAQCVINVLSNAVRYAKEIVEVSVYKDKNFGCIKICDDGKGIDQNEIDKVFERFYKGEGGQTGLGLAIANSAVKAMGGEIIVYNSTRGACFEIRLKIINS